MINIDEAQSQALVLASNFRSRLNETGESGLRFEFDSATNSDNWGPMLVKLHKDAIPLILDYLLSSELPYSLTSRVQAFEDALTNTMELEETFFKELYKSSFINKKIASAVNAIEVEVKKLKKEFEEEAKLLKGEYEVVEGEVNIQEIVDNIEDFNEDYYDFGPLHEEICRDLYQLQDTAATIATKEHLTTPGYSSHHLENLDENEILELLRKIFMERLSSVVLKESQDILKTLNNNELLSGNTMAGDTSTSLGRGRKLG